MKKTYIPFAVAIIFSLLILTPDTYAEACVSTHFDEKAYIERAIDGDTVVLEDGRHVRLIGINTPELDHEHGHHEFGALEATSDLQGLIGKRSSVGLVYDAEKQDRHGRTLAHLFLTNGTNIQSSLLERGRAMPLVIPPNLKFQDCYSNAASLARNLQRGLWTSADYQPIDTNRLSTNDKGFRIITAKVSHTGQSRSSFWINLEGDVALRIIKKDLVYFNLDTLKSLSGKKIEAMGWLYKKKKQLRMRIRHIQALRILD